jgi:hypothetical protein
MATPSLFAALNWSTTSAWGKYTQLSILAFVGFIAWFLCLVLYRLFLHPLRNVPGPKLAAATGWYEFYQDVILDGHYLHDYPRLHAKYGACVPVMHHPLDSTWMTADAHLTTRSDNTCEPRASPHQ